MIKVQNQVQNINEILFQIFLNPNTEGWIFVDPVVDREVTVPHYSWIIKIQICW